MSEQQPQHQQHSIRRILLNRLWKAIFGNKTHEDILPFHHYHHDQYPSHQAAQGGPEAAPGPLPTHPHQGGMVPRHNLTITRTDADHLVPPEDKLLVFRSLTGIDAVPTLRTLPHMPRRSIENVGIYKRVHHAEATAASRYRMFSILINTCLSIQIVVAAALTALGAAAGPHSAVTTFGAINTIVAGILTYLKGSGLPDRLKHYQNEWRNIREYIEQRERELCLDGCWLNVQEEILYIEQMYEGVKREIEATKSGGENRGGQRTQEQRSRRAFLPPESSGLRSNCSNCRDNSPTPTEPEKSLDKPEKH